MRINLLSQKIDLRWNFIGIGAIELREVDLEV